MTKKILLTAVALGALATAGVAAAQAPVTPRSLAFRTSATVADIDLGVVGAAANATYRLAEEVNLAANASNTVALRDTLSTGASLPSGNVILTVTLTGATFGNTFGSTGVSGDVATCPGFTAVPSTGGAGTDTVAVFVISNSSATCNAFNLDVPVRPSGTGAVTVSSNLRTDGNPGTPLDGGTVSRQVISRVNAFQVAVDGAIGAGALADTFADLNTIPPYAAFDHVGPAPEGVQLGQLGTVALLVDTTAFADLTTTNPVVLADVTDADLTVTGSFTAYNGTGGFARLGAVNATFGTGQATAIVANQQGLLATPAGAPVPLAFQVDPEDAANIPVSNYIASVAYTLAAEFIAEGPAGGALETVGREGTNVLLPWMNSQSIAAANGTNNIVRISNTGGQAATVSGDVVTTTNGAAGYTDQGIVTLGVVPAGGELVLTAAQLAPLGDFGRGDVQLIVESNPAQITVKRFSILANGNVTEFESGSVASDQNAVNVP